VSETDVAPGTAALVLQQTYVSLPPGTIPGASIATATNLMNGAKRSAAMLDGGLDPVPLSASEGDEIELVVTDSSGATFSMRAPVPPKRPPVVVRTSPPRGRTDVSLNSIIIVVFSEPMSPALPDEAVAVSDGSEIVDATAALSPDGLTLEIVPAQPLQPGTRHEVSVAASVADRSGDQMGTGYVADFVTETVSAASIEIKVDSVEHLAGSAVPIVAVVRDETGAPISSATVTWSSSDPQVADVAGSSKAAQAVSVGTGRVVITARSGSVVTTRELVFAALEFTALSGGGAFTCGTTIHGTMHCWGHGQPTATPSVPVLRPLAGTFVLPVSGAEHACAMRDDGRLVCWGRAFGTVPRLQGREEDRFIDASSAGLAHTCGVRADGAAFCWGTVEAERGSGTYTSGGPMPVEPGPVYAAAAAGRDFQCLLTRDGGIACGGLNHRGQRGSGHFAYFPSYWYDTSEEADAAGGLIRVAPLIAAGRFAAVAAGGAHACALTTEGEAVCWGDNVYGQLGADFSPSCFPDSEGLGCRSSVPLRATGGLRFVDIAAGGEFTCGLLTDGGVTCWGRNDAGQLGRGQSGTPGSPGTLVANGGIRFRSITAGGQHACGIAVDDGLAYCWGANGSGQLGDGTLGSSSVPVAVLLQE
jgi:alpha-tubulin suppressor-like RCC1 family protein